MKRGGIALVTGATGLVGRHLVEALVRRGVRVRASDRQAPPTGFFRDLEIDFLVADVTDPKSLPPLFAGEVERVFHLAAICNFSTPYKALYPINVQGVERMSRLALEHGVERFVHVSTTSVYGPYLGRPFTEASPRTPHDDYGRSKKAGEDALFEQIARGLPAVIVRPSVIYGPGCTGGAGKVFSRKTSFFAVPGDGQKRLANVRVEDVANALVHIAGVDGIEGEAFNLSDDSETTLGEAMRAAAEAFGGSPPRVHLPFWLVRGIVRVQGVAARLLGRIPDFEIDAVRYLSTDYIVDSSKLKATGFELQYPNFLQSVRSMGESRKGTA